MTYDTCTGEANDGCEPFEPAEDTAPDAGEYWGQSLSPLPLPSEQRVPRPLTEDEQKRADKIRAELDAKRQAALAPKLEALSKAFPSKHDPKPPKAKKVVQAFDPFAPREAGDVDWEKQKQDTSQRRVGGKRKPVSGKK